VVPSSIQDSAKLSSLFAISIKGGLLKFTLPFISRKHSLNEYFFKKWVEVWVMLFGIGVLGFAPLYGFSVMVLLVSALGALAYGDKTVFCRPFAKEERQFVYLVSLYFSAHTFAVFYQPQGYEYESLGRQLAAFDYVSRWLLMIPVWLLFRAYKIDWIFLGMGLAIGSIIGALFGH
jgi:hypothetical protein